MVAILWSNGQVDSADDWQALLDKLRQSQPRKMSEQRFRQELGRRARIWAGYRINTDLPPAKLFQELEWAKVIIITEHDNDDQKGE